MAGIRCTARQSHPKAFLECTRVTREEFQPLLPPCETAFPCRMAGCGWLGTLRTTRRVPVYKTCPLPPPEERLFLLLTSLQTDTLQVVHARLFGMVQGKANQSMHALLLPLLAALRALGAAPPAP